MINNHVPTIFLCDSSKEVIAALANLFSDRFLPRVGVVKIGRYFDSADHGGDGGSNRIKDRDQLTLQNDDARDRQIRHREVPQACSWNGKPSRLRTLLQGLAAILCNHRQHRETSAREGGGLTGNVAHEDLLQWVRSITKRR